MSEPPITPGSLRSSCHSGLPFSKSPNSSASSKDVICSDNFDTGKVSLSLFLVGNPRYSLGVGLPFAGGFTLVSPYDIKTARKKIH
jgi:hypothetical protein